MMKLDLSRPLIVGFGITGRAMAKALLDHNISATICDDRLPSGPVDIGLTVVGSPTEAELADYIDAASLVLPSPGIPAHHPLFRLADERGVPIGSEFDLAGCWDDRPVVGITGTNGKTTVTMMVTDALCRSGIPAAAVGNTETPWVEALTDPELEVFVVEASSFRLAHSAQFSPTVATWLNFSPDHLDAHLSLDAYEAAKASIWASLPPGAVAIGNAEDAVVMAHLPASAQAVTFGLDKGDWRRHGSELIGPDGSLVSIDQLKRRQPHDLSNACAVAATATAAGADRAAILETLATFEGLPHRVQFVGEWDGVRWYNDSKATVPHATLAAVGGFKSVVLIAGGRNKGLDLSPLTKSVPPVRAVIATGDAGPEVTEILGPLVSVTPANTMQEAVEVAASLALPGDTVLLSPACTSFDWYSGYGERGRDFMRIVAERFQ